MPRRPIIVNPYATPKPETSQDFHTFNSTCNPSPSPAHAEALHYQLPNFNPAPLIQLSHHLADIFPRSRDRTDSRTESQPSIRLYAKIETNRAGLPSFKILGASWGVCRALAARLGMNMSGGGAGQGQMITIEQLVMRLRAAEEEVRDRKDCSGEYTNRAHDHNSRLALFTATDGNHGRAVAAMARILGIEAHIYVPAAVALATDDAHGQNLSGGGIQQQQSAAVAAIVDEGARVHIVHDDYDGAVRAAFEACAARERAQQWGGNTTHSVGSGGSGGVGGLFVQDTALPGYEEVPRWIVEGYATMLDEVDRQLIEATDAAPSGVGDVGVRYWDRSIESPPLAQVSTPSEIIYVCPVGVGSLCHAVVEHCRQWHPPPHYNVPYRIITVEPEAAPCLYENLSTRTPEQQPLPVSTIPTIMAGLNCGTVSPISWPSLIRSIDVAVTVSDREAHEAVHELAGIGYAGNLGVVVGPCGAATLAALKRVMVERPDVLDKDAVVVLLCTEGPRPYTIPEDD